jgi:CRISPR system Cascade subunit CasC
MNVEIHVLQNFAPSCLNRDDTNTPKDCEFGGHRRARISSQCIKRSVRRYFAAEKLLPEEHLAERSKRLVGEVAQAVAAQGRDAGPAAERVKAALAAVRLMADPTTHETQYLLFLGRREIDALAGLIHRHWDALGVAPADEPPTDDAKKGRKTNKQKKSEAREAVPAEVAKQVKAVFDGG